MILTSADIDIKKYFAKESADPLSSAFEGKITVHAGYEGSIASGREANKALEKALNGKRHRNTSAYIHVPFCETRCLYCGFYNKPYKKEESKLYADTLIKELEMWSGKEAVYSFPVNALYFGGGTPTAIESSDMKRIIGAAKNFLPLANDCEITIEGRISDITEEKIESCLSSGVNRFSLGVQTFNTDIRKAMGRLSSEDEIINKLKMVKSYNQASIVIDLIYGFPNQNMDVWKNDLKTAVSLDLHGFDCYQLNVLAFTLLGKYISEGKIPPSADNKLKSALFSESVKYLSSSFYRRLSINHWARTTRERNFYNQFARGNADCLAYGPCAGGNINGLSYMAERDYGKWKESVNSGVKPVACVALPSRYHELYKTISEHIEYGYLNLNQLEERFNIPLESLCAPLFSQWEHAGLIICRKGSVSLTLAGEFWYVNISQLLINYIKECLEKTNK